MDDLYNNLKVYEPEVKGMSSSSTSTQNMAFMSSSNNNSTNGAVNTPQAVNTTIGVSTVGSQVNTANIDNLSDDVIYTFLTSQPSSPQHESTRRTVPVETPTLTTLVSCDRLGGYDWSDQAEEGLNFALMAYTSSSSDSKKGLGCENYNVVPPPYTGNLMPPKPNLSFAGLDELDNKPVVEDSKSVSSQENPKKVRTNIDAPIIKEWVSDDEDDEMIQPKFEQKIVKTSIAKIEFVKPKQPKKKATHSVSPACRPMNSSERAGRLGLQLQHTEQIPLLSRLRILGKTLIDLEATKETIII
nr:hypothetical protein [Tanacetum cinerariifolium]